MLYLGTSPCEPAINDLLNQRRIGLMCQPKSNPPKVGWLWAADNGCFNEQWDEDKWYAWLERDHPACGCLFAVVPDVVGDARETLRRFEWHAPLVRELRYPLAYVAQDGFERTVIPWDEFDCLFIGGTTDWKMSEHARRAAERAREKGKWVHVGRVNTAGRFRSWATHADSCDGTFLAFGPTVNTPRLVRWLDAHDAAPQLDFSRVTRDAP